MMKRARYMPTEDIGEELGLETGAMEMLFGLTSPRKHLPCKFFYDETGSKLFEQITSLEEYYLSRIEKSILKQHAEELMRGTQGLSLVELGSGDCSKISIILHALPRARLKRSTYVPIDLSPSALEASRYKLQARFGPIEIDCITADFTSALDLAAQHKNRIFCFFGSTIGNLNRRDAAEFIAKLGKLLKPGERLLLGLDMVKDKAVLEQAYNDKKGITATFNKNILTVANNILEADFEPAYFRHRAFYDTEQQRIEMHLVALKNMTVRSPFFRVNIQILKDQTIHTENSHKFTWDHIEEFASISGLSVRAVYSDSNQWFTLSDFIK